MADMQRLIEMLQSENSKERYNACEELRVSPSIPPEAIQALRSATRDANPNVAEAAQRAIMLHTSDASNSSIIDKNPPPDGSSISGGTGLTCTAVLVSIALGLTFFVMSLFPSEPGQGAIIVLPFSLAWLIVVIAAVVKGFRSTRSQVKATSSAYLYLMITLAAGSIVIPLAVREGGTLFDALLCASPGLVGIGLAVSRLWSH
jgi:hypothetical protein